MDTGQCAPANLCPWNSSNSSGIELLDPACDLSFPLQLGILIYAFFEAGKQRTRQRRTGFGWQR
jgi:hypothetical protein